MDKYSWLIQVLLDYGGYCVEYGSTWNEAADKAEAKIIKALETEYERGLNAPRKLPSKKGDIPTLTDDLDIEQ
jgi:hypothetical protein